MNEKIKSLLGSRRSLIVMLAAVAVGVLLLCIPSGGDNEDNSVTSDGLAEYKAKLEFELADTCSAVEGVGRCRIMVTFERGAENVYKGSQLIESSPPRVLGVSVVCEGGASAEVKSSLTEMIAALFGVGKNRIAVLELKN